mmetsp:Transcript_7535/g.16717  ORF Transcript_7535/g.16717 Transcript_7535/m.16717 type:complete len:231 (+) Transcript_7535:3657-4349(+)
MRFSRRTRLRGRSVRFFPLETSLSTFSNNSFFSRSTSPSETSESAPPTQSTLLCTFSSHIEASVICLLVATISGSCTGQTCSISSTDFFKASNSIPSPSSFKHFNSFAAQSRPVSIASRTAFIFCDMTRAEGSLLPNASSGVGSACAFPTRTRKSDSNGLLSSESPLLPCANASIFPKTSLVYARIDFQIFCAFKISSSLQVILQLLVRSIVLLSSADIAADASLSSEVC